jgi:nucleotide-binding universal stress UspA family protein
MKTLIAIVNEPGDSKEFVQYVLNLAVDLQTNVHFLHVQDPAHYSFGTPGMTGDASVQVQVTRQNMADDARKILARYVEAYAPEDVSVKISTEMGILKLIIEKLLSDNKIHMVILEGVESDGFWTSNSTHMDIIRNVKCPVWVIPKQSTYRAPREILYATDYKEEDLATLNKLIALTKHFSPKITAIHITENLDFEVRIQKAGFQEMLQTKTSYDQVCVKSLVEETGGEDIGQLVNNYASLIEANLIVVLKENRHFFDRLFNSSATKKIVQQAKIPVLVYHA